ncbi:lipoprotein [Pigmentiphaga litoralis]|jgi:lipid-binding SYLF domain-containing protein|uniref:BPSL1445 family SYLF domain-containing lipoprotein n=1 Tax=Pigmentiphaga litoralis TaxID=516702 RepID=UPI001678D893|nr:YSC84-related protein [Pigmentiphaga litoralis]GGX28421.1 lipoprotein [Pigmentiphaga litoralis]
MQRRKMMAGLVMGAAALMLGACTTTPQTPVDKTAKRTEINNSYDAALTKLYASAPSSRELVSRARGVLVFPNVLAAGLGVGGEYGDGALKVGNRTEGYYRTISGTFGLQIGAQSKAVILLFMTQDSLDKFVASKGWTAGVDASVAVAKVGANGEIDTNTIRQPVIGFVVTNAGLMANLTVEGTKITRLDL